MASLLGFGAVAGSRGQVLRPLGTRSARPIATLPFNMQAVEIGIRFGEGLIPFAMIAGPSGWGKSQILRTVEESLEKHGKDVMRAKAVDFLRSRRKAEAPELLLLDDLGDAIRTPRPRHQLRLLLERRMRLNRPTLVVFTGDKITPAMIQVLPMARLWEKALVFEPGETEKIQVVGYMAERIGLTVSLGLARMMARHMDGNCRSYLGALERLKLCGSDWSQPADICRAVGVLAPHIASHSWDPRDEVFEAVTKTVGEESNLVSDLCSYLLLREMQLPERDVATFLDVSPSSVYTKAKKLGEALADPMTSALVQDCRLAVVSRLSAC